MRDEVANCIAPLLLFLSSLCQELLVEPVIAQLCTSYEVRLNAIEPNLKKQLCSDKVYTYKLDIAADFLMK